MSENIEVRRLPKKSIYFIVVIIVLGIVAMLATSFTQQEQMKTVLKTLGYENVGSMTIYNKTPVQDESSNQGAELTKLKFTDLNTNKECFGFVLRIKKTGQYKKDLDCK